MMPRVMSSWGQVSPSSSDFRSPVSIATLTRAARCFVFDFWHAAKSKPEAAAVQRETAVRPATTPASPQSATLPVATRLSSDRKTLILLEEITEPSSKRQPQIELGTDPNTGTPRVRVGARGMEEAPNVTVRCGTATHSLPLRDFAEVTTWKIAEYGVSKETANTMLASSSCHMAILGVLLPIPPRELSIVWSGSSRISAPT